MPRQGHGKSGHLSDRLRQKAPRRYFTFGPIFISGFFLSALEAAWSPLDQPLSELLENPYWVTILFLGMVTMVTVLPCHVYLWFVVKSLRHRHMMEISIGFDARRQQVHK